VGPTERSALVTGCGKLDGIGAEVARTLARLGFAVVITDIEPAGDLEAVVAQIADAGGSASAVLGDVAQEAAAERMVAETVRRHGRIDVLVNNAAAPFGIGHGDIEAIALADWDRVIAVNLRGPFLTCRAAVPHMRRQGWGRIVNMSSTAGRTGGKGNGT